MAYLGNPPSSLVSTSAITQTFTGDGGSTFNLTRIVTDNNPASLEVFVSNVQQQPTVSYSIVSGNVLTFSQAPGSGEPIYVIFRDHPSAPKVNIPDLAITTAKIQANAVTTTKIAEAAVTTERIGANAVTTAKIAESAITTARLNDNAVSTAKIAESAITTARVDDNAITTAKIAESAITTARLNDDAVTDEKLSALSNIQITGGNITQANIYNVGLKVLSISSSSNVITLDYQLATVFLCNATEAANITLSNFPESGVVLLKLTNGGNHVIDYAGNASFATATAPTLTTNGKDYLYFEGNANGYLVTSVLDVRES